MMKCSSISLLLQKIKKYFVFICVFVGTCSCPHACIYHVSIGLPTCYDVCMEDNFQFPFLHAFLGPNSSF